jgi:hypothetical protein
MTRSRKVAAPSVNVIGTGGVAKRRRQRRAPGHSTVATVVAVEFQGSTIYKCFR